MAKSKKDVEGGLGIHARRAIAYIVLIIISFFCLFWFYIMFINATRSKGELKAGFTALPSDHLLTNWNNLVHGTLPIWSGMFKGAKAYMVAAGNSVLLMDSENSAFYIKSTDASGMPLPLRVFDYKERTTATKMPPQTAQQPGGEFVTRAEFYRGECRLSSHSLFL